MESEPSNQPTEPSRNNDIVVRVNKDSPSYNMNYSKRGIALIFNHKIFNITDLSEISGSDIDKKNLVTCLKNLGFEVDDCDDYNTEGVLAKVDEVAELDHSDYDCFLMFVLSHGDEGAIVYAHDTAYLLERLWKPFTADKCPTLTGKPKLFFFQVHHGYRVDSGVSVTQYDTCSSFKIPCNADFLLTYSTIPAHYSSENEKPASIFVQKLCEELRENAYKTDLLTLLTFVNRKIALGFESSTEDPLIDEEKQVLYITYTLTRLVQFRPKINV